MTTRLKFLLAAAGAAAVTLLTAAPAGATKPRTTLAQLDLNTAAGANLANRKIQCSLQDNVASVYWFHGESFSRVPGERDRKLFNVEGMNIRQCVTITDPVRGQGWRLVTRELLLYVDPKTGELLKTWANPWTGETVNVIHTANDPVNQRPQFALDKDGKPSTTWDGTISGDTWWDTITVPLFYTNPLAGDYQKYVGGTYHATEMFNFFGSVSDLTNTKKPSADVHVGWVRVASWLPWMEMGDRAGVMYVNAAGRKLASFDELPPVILKAIAQDYPAWRAPPPGDDARPNETSWTYFKKKIPPPASK